MVVVGLSGCGEIQNNDKDTTPVIEFSPVNGWLRVISIDQEGLQWSNINISLSSSNYSDIGFHHSNITSYLASYGNGSSCPTSWGIITSGNELYFYNVNAIVTLTWIPTDIILGRWDFR